jgi:putative ABC transport system substrate-binding protein
MTGFSHPEGAIAGKWLEMIKEVAPSIRRVAFMFDPDYQVAQYLRPLSDAAKA